MNIRRDFIEVEKFIPGMEDGWETVRGLNKLNKPYTINNKLIKKYCGKGFQGKTFRFAYFNTEKGRMWISAHNYDIWDKTAHKASLEEISPCWHCNSEIENYWYSVYAILKDGSIIDIGEVVPEDSVEEAKETLKSKYGENITEIATGEYCPHCLACM